MKKFITVFLTVVLLTSSAICASAKAYNFKDNEVWIILTEVGTQFAKDGEIKINKAYFADSKLGIRKVRCEVLTDTFSLYTLVLDKHDHENVLKAAKILKEYDFIETAGTNGYIRIPEHYLDKVDVVLKAGQTEKVTAHMSDLKDVTVKKWKSSDEEVATVKNGKITALKEGTAKIIAVDTVGRKLTCKLRVTSSPKLTQNKKTVTSVTVKKGKTVEVKITGKAKKIDNKYINTRKAKIISKKSAKTIKVQGLKKGTTTVKIKVNGVKMLKLKVKVK